LTFTCKHELNLSVLSGHAKYLKEQILLSITLFYLSEKTKARRRENRHII